MPDLMQTLKGLISTEDRVKEVATRTIINEFKVFPGELAPNVLVFIAKRLGDENAIVRKGLAVFLHEYVKSGRDLGPAWVYFTRFTRSNDQQVRTLVLDSYQYLDKGESVLKGYLATESRMPDNVKFYAAEALAHFYLRQKYFSSFSELLNNASIIAKAAMYGYNYEKALGRIGPSDVRTLEPKVISARIRLERPKEIIRHPTVRRPVERRPVRQ